MDSLSAETIRAGLDTAFVGRNSVYLTKIGSTNDEARRLAQLGAPDGTLVIADHQTSGRGRLGRRWQAPPGSSLLMSLILRPSLAPQQAQRLTMVCGLAVADAVQSETGLRIALKWPNDLVVQGSKVGGILTEIELAGDRVDYAVVGIGLNVNVNPDALTGDLVAPASSLSRLLGHPVARLPLLWAFLRAVEARLLAMKAGWSPHEEWAARLSTLRQPVTVSTPKRAFSGVAEGVDANGALQVRLADGCLETVLAGDVTLRGPH